MYVDKMVGGADFEIEVQVEDDVGFRAVMAGIRHLFPDIAGRYESLLYFKEHKMRYLPAASAE